MIRPYYPFWFKWACFIAVPYLLISCDQGDKSAEESEYILRIQDLEEILEEKESFIYSLSNEISSINTMFDQIGYFGDSIDLLDTSVDITDRILYFDSLLVASNERISYLEKQVENAPSPGESDLLTVVVKDLRQSLADKERIIASLNRENDSLKVGNAELAENLNEQIDIRTRLQQEVKEQEQKLSNLRKSLEREKLAFEREREELMHDLQQTKLMIDEEKAKAHFDIAKGLLEQYDSAKEGLQLGKRKMRRDLLEQAYYHFRQACLLGERQASNFIRILLTNKEYSKDLTVQQSGKQLTECGI
jgi:small-conductance mechanosensitive channel